MAMENVSMVDLKNQYLKIQSEVDAAIFNCVAEGKFINGPQVQIFQKNLENYLNINHVIPCANGTDALQIAFMSLGLKAGDEVIIPSFNYFASAEALMLLNIIPVFVDVNPHNFNIDESKIKEAIGPKTKAIVAVHLFGQNANLESIKNIADKHNLFLIEDAAQSLGANYYFQDGSIKKSGTIGHISTTSFFPSKNLGCFGDGGAILTNDAQLAERAKMIANHGQIKKYEHKFIGLNSRLDSIQAAVLNVKLKYLDRYNEARKIASDLYLKFLMGNSSIKLPHIENYSEHIFHQYTIILEEGIDREKVRQGLAALGIPSMIYYPNCIHQQEALMGMNYKRYDLFNSEWLSKSVLSLPMHTELSENDIEGICKNVNQLTTK